MKNLKRFGFLDQVTLINGCSFDPNTIAMVRQISGARQLGCSFLMRTPMCVAISTPLATDLPIVAGSLIDDYLGGADKSGKLRTQVDELVSAGRLEPLGFYGFGTWIGRWFDRHIVIFLSTVSARLVHIINS